MLTLRQLKKEQIRYSEHQVCEGEDILQTECHDYGGRIFNTLRTDAVVGFWREEFQYSERRGYGGGADSKAETNECLVLSIEPHE